MTASGSRSSPVVSRILSVLSRAFQEKEDRNFSLWRMSKYVSFTPGTRSKKAAREEEDSETKETFHETMTLF